jgi:hypothetical protein
LSLVSTIRDVFTAFITAMVAIGTWDKRMVVGDVSLIGSRLLDLAV